MHKKHKPRRAGVAVMIATAFTVILLINQDRSRKILRLEAEIRQEVESRIAPTRQEVLAEEIQPLQYRYIKGCPLSKKIQRDIFHICEDAALSFDRSCPSYMKKADGIRDAYRITGNLSDLCRYRKDGIKS